jgi:hypothetical protein
MSRRQQLGDRLHSFTPDDGCSVPQLKVYLSWKSRSSVGVPQLEVSVLLSGIALSIAIAGHSPEYTG